jgi:4-amino-4-deoxychorismate lyase
VQQDAVAADDRGIAYGDGLFETMRAHQGDVPWWNAHWARLQRGATRLHIPLPDENNVRAEAALLLRGSDSVLKLIVTRGSGGRGYAPLLHATSTWILSSHPVPSPAPTGGIVLRWCDTRLAVQPMLAGIKHCNRLEQVLARAEWSDPGSVDHEAFEGLMLSTDGDVISATSANLFVLRDGRWLTPPIDRCGVAGVCRAWALKELSAEESPLDMADIESADAVFLCNAVRGILPVAKLGGRTWPVHAQVVALMQRLAAIHPAFSL